MTSPILGRLHDAQARDEHKCQETAREREVRRKQRQEEEYFNAPTPLQYMHYSEQEAVVLGEKLRDKETFQQAVFILNTWLEKGECYSYNVDSFFSMIQIVNSHVTRLMNEKLKYEDEHNKAKLMLMKKNQCILLQLNEILKVLKTASIQKVWDHFTKTQRKNIDLLKKQTEEIKNAYEEVLNDHSNDEKEYDAGVSKKTSDTSDQKNKLKEENETIRRKLEAVVNETAVLRSETAQELELKERSIQGLMQALQRSINTLNPKRVADEAGIEDLQSFKAQRIMGKDYYQDDNKGFNKIDMCEVSSTSSDTNISESEAHLISLITIFLHMHPFGANIDYICSYLKEIFPTIQPSDVESLMKRFPTIYREDTTGIGASLRKKWRFLGLEL